MVKKGDTLIEVTLAIGIFSMIAIAIVSVMSSGTAGAQTALETTLAREEIDTQAEALRFIQSSAINDKNSADKRFYNLWKKIVDVGVNGHAFDLSSMNNTQQNAILQYAPKTCADNYEDDGLIYKKAFVINPKMLGTYAKDSDPSSRINSVLYGTASNKLIAATTYPRLVFNGDANNDLTYDNNVLYRAEGIYVIAVKDPGTTNINNTDASAYYDFYIRTCWYGIDANEPSTISTVIRLYDPDALSE